MMAAVGGKERLVVFFVLGFGSGGGEGRENGGEEGRIQRAVERAKVEGYGGEWTYSYLETRLLVAPLPRSPSALFP